MVHNGRKSTANASVLAVKTRTDEVVGKRSGERIGNGLAATDEGMGVTVPHGTNPLQLPP